MDLELHLQVLRRARSLLIVGAVVGVLLAFLSMYEVGLSGVSKRGSTTWQASSEVLVSQQGFPWGRSVDQLLPADPKSGLPVRGAADIDRLTRLSVLYAQLANSDPVRKILRRGGPADGSVRAVPVYSFVNEAANATVFTLPLIRITATSSTAKSAVVLSRRAAEALSGYIAQKQAKAAVPANQRAQVEVVRRARGAAPSSGSSSVLPFFVFMATMIGFVGLAYMLERLRPRAQTDKASGSSAVAAELEQPATFAVVREDSTASGRWS